MSKDPYCSDSDWEAGLHAASAKCEVLKTLCGKLEEEGMDGHEPEIESPVAFWGGLREIAKGIQDDVIAALQWEEPKEPKETAGEATTG